MNIDHINERYHGDLTDPSTERARQRIHWICGEALGPDILDVGCSQGIVCLILGREGFRCTGVDLEGASLAVAREALAKEDDLVRRRVGFQAADATRLPFADESFDTVVLGEILEHLTHPQRAVSEAKRVLRNGGRVVVTVPHGLNAFHDHKRSYYPLSLLELLQPEFRTRSIDASSHYILYTGLKEPGYRPETVSKESLFEEHLRLERMVEARCLQKEQELLETATRLYAQIKSLTTQTAAQKDQLQKLAEAGVSQDQRVHTLAKNLKEARHATAELRSGLSRTETELTATNAAFARARLEAASGAAALAALQSQLAGLSAENAALRSGLLGKDQELLRLKAEADTAGTTLAAAQQQLKGLESEITALRQELSTRDALLARTQVEKEGAAGALAAVQGQLDRLQTENASLRGELLAKEKAILALRTEAAHAASSMTSLRQQCEALETECAALRQARSASEESLSTARTELAASNETLAAVQREAQALRTEAADLRQEMTAQHAAGERQFAHADDQHAQRLREREQHLRELALKRESEWKRGQTNQRIRELARTTLPTEARVLVISKGDEDLVRLVGGRSGHFPQGAGGVYAGYHPANGRDAVAHLEALKAGGAEYLLIPASAFWWLEFYAELRQHLDANARLIAYDEAACLIYALKPPQAASSPAFGLVLSRASDAGAAPRATPPKSAAHPATSAVGAHAPHASPAPPADLPRLGVILDEFTTGCLAPECRPTSFRPDNWKEVLTREPPAAVFVESAWRGNGGAWLYRVASYPRDMGSELADLIAWAGEHGIPSVFWNKEDPVHFERFIERAKLFSHVFTTDADCLPRYRDQVRHERVYALPFAAQPALHHPIRSGPRTGAVCFAGTYYGNRHAQRQSDMDFLLRPAIPFGLEIYDRQHGLAGKEAETYRFPEVYQPCIRGRLDYDEMVKAYKQYRLFLNVNSVKQSPTMFSRRVFELLACGTPVISTYSRGIVELLGEDVVFITESEADTRRHLERLLGDDEEWARASVRGIRRVMQAHTYHHRLQSVFERIGIPLPEPREPRVSVIVLLETASDFDRLAQVLRNQTFRRFDLILLSRTSPPARALQRLRNALSDIPVASVVGPIGEAYSACLKASAAGHLAFMDLRDGYGPDYLLDHALAVSYSGADLIGKHTFCRATASGEPRLQNPGHEFSYVTSVQSATLLARKASLSRKLFLRALSGRVLSIDGGRILSLDRSDYLQNAPSERPPPNAVAIRPAEASA